MKLNEPKIITWWVAVVVAVIGVIGYLVSIPVLSTIAVWLIVAAFVLLAVANLVKGL